MVVYARKTHFPVSCHVQAQNIVCVPCSAVIRCDFSPRFFKTLSQCKKSLRFPLCSMACTCCVRVVASARDPLVRSSQFLAGSASWSRALPERCGTSCSPTTPSSSSATGVAQSCRLPVQDEGAIVEQDLRYLSRSAAHQHADGPKNELGLTTQFRERAS